MRLELPLILVVVALILVDGCGARSGNTEASVSPGRTLIPDAQKPEPESPQSDYHMPLDIRIDAPDAPEEIRRPSPPVPPGTPFPGSILDSIFNGKSNP
jgi:hypothetical protein